MIRLICIAIALVSMSLASGCKSNEYKKLGESCKQDGDCVTDAFCIEGHQGDKMCLQKCGSGGLAGVKYPDCPDGWSCGGMAELRDEKTGEVAFAGLADYAVCVKPEWMK
jgi:hypothetical protein